jgi:hypothetical protein
VTYGDNAVAFYTPTISNGGGPGGGPGGGNSSSTVISAPTTPSLSTGNNVTDGTAHFEGNCYVSGTVGIENFETEDIIVRSLNGTIIVEGCEGCEVNIFNMEGRRVSNRGLATGVYLVKVGDYPTRKIVVTR